MAKDYSGYSYWLETSGDDLTPRAPLDGSITVDVAILGAGFTGLWTAYHLLQRDPALKVAIIEAEIAGFGASGRNGGWCFSGFPMHTPQMRETYGDDVAKAVQLAMYGAVDNVGDVCEREGIDAHYAKTGVMNLARGDYDLPGLEARMAQYRALGIEDHYELLDKAGADAHVRVARTVGAIWAKEGATVQPARLARGLARAVERHGATIYEQTRVTNVVPGPLPRLDTARGNVSARVVVLAGEAYLSQLPGLERQIIPMTSHIVLTEPLSEAQWAQIGWEQREVMGAMGTTAGYLNKTVDGRIAFGAFRAKYPFNSKITDDLDKDEEIFEHARRSTIDWFPMLEGVRFTHAWGGVFGRPRDRLPMMTLDRATGIATARGYSGEGVATANLSGQVLSDLITEADTDLTKLPMTTHQSKNWEPEPLRYLGVSYVRRSMAKLNEQVEREGKYPEKQTLAQKLFQD